jgi:hypothetical protein
MRAAPKPVALFDIARLETYAHVAAARRAGLITTEDEARWHAAQPQPSRVLLGGTASQLAMASTAEIIAAIADGTVAKVIGQAELARRYHPAPTNINPRTGRRRQ